MSRWKPGVSSTQLDQRRSAGVAAGAHNEVRRPKVRAAPQARFRRGLKVPMLPRSEDPAALAPSRAQSPSRKKAQPHTHLSPGSILPLPLFPLSTSSSPPSSQNLARSTLKRTKGTRVCYCQKHKRLDGPTAHVHRWDALTTGQGRLVLQINSCQALGVDGSTGVCCSKKLPTNNPTCRAE